MRIAGQSFVSRRHAWLAVVAAVVMMVTLGLTAGLAQAQYYSACSSEGYALICLYDGHTGNGDVSVSATLTNQSSRSFAVGQFTLAAPGHWTVQCAPASGTIAGHQTLLCTKSLSVRSWKGDIRTAWGNNGGILDGVDNTMTW